MQVQLKMTTLHVAAEMWHNTRSKKNNAHSQFVWLAKKSRVHRVWREWHFHRCKSVSVTPNGQSQCSCFVDYVAIMTHSDGKKHSIRSHNVISRPCYGHCCAMQRVYEEYREFNADWINDCQSNHSRRVCIYCNLEANCTRLFQCNHLRIILNHQQKLNYPYWTTRS